MIQEYLLLVVTARVLNPQASEVPLPPQARRSASVLGHAQGLDSRGRRPEDERYFHVDEGVACEVDKLADMSVDLIDMFERHGYGDASVFGHAMEVHAPRLLAGFRNAGDIDQFAKMMQVDLAKMMQPSTRLVSISR